MRTLPLAFALLPLFACTGKTEESAPPEDTAGDTSDSAPPEETGDSAPPEETAVETAETGEPLVDLDADGSPEGEDCNDADPAVHPGAVDVACDGIDADCDGVGLADVVLIGDTRYPDIASAVAAASAGDTIDLCPGAHAANLVIDAPAILTLRSVSGTEADTEIDGGAAGPVIAVGSGVDLTIEDLGIVNGMATWRNDTYRQSGGGIYAEDARLTLRRARVATNEAQDQGAGIALVVGSDTAALIVEDSTFTDNRASDNGGAIAVLGAGDAEIAITGSTFTTNRAPGRGAGVYVEGAPLAASIADSTFTTNDASGGQSYGGAVSAGGDEVSLTITDSTFTGNTAGNSAGALSMLADRSELSMDGCTFSSNTATQGGGAVRITADELSVDVLASNFDANLANTQGGAIELDGAGYATFDTVAVTGNSAGNAGGAYYFLESAGAYLEVSLDGGTVTTNRAGIGGGGGVYAAGARVLASSVDFGASSSDTNSPEDVYNCSADLGSSASFEYDDSVGAFCR